MRQNKFYVKSTVTERKTKTIIAVIAVVAIFSTGMTFQAYLIFQLQKPSLAKIKPELDYAVDNSFQEIRRNMVNDLVFLQQLDNDTNILINKYDGYIINVPNHWKIDNVNFQYVTNLYTDNFKLSIFKQEIDLSYDLTQRYIDYSNFRIRQEYGGISLIADEAKTIGPYNAQTLSWKRDKITTIINDLNYYYESNIILDNKTVLTLLAKSNQSSFSDYRQKIDQIMAKITFIDQTSYQTLQHINKNISDIVLNGRTVTFNIPNNKCLFGIYHAPHQDYTQELISLERSINFKFQVIMDYYSFNTVFNQVQQTIQSIYNDKRTMLVTLQPFVTKSAKNFSGSCLIPEIINGEYDDFLFQWASGLKEMGEPIFLRFGNEMNGDWVDWCAWFYSLDPDLYVMAWTRIYTLFKEAGADNVYFVWNPHDRTYPDYKWNKEYLYYPGDSKVDWIGLTAYNNGITRSNEFWREFNECYTQPYLEYMSRYSSKPFMITEFACNEIGGDKAQWITQGFSLLQQKFQNIRIAIWWNGIDGTWIYDIDSSPQSLNAFKGAIASPYFQFKSIISLDK